MARATLPRAPATPPSRRLDSSASDHDPTVTQPPFEILLSHDVLQRRIAELAQAIAAAGVDPPPRLVAVIEGARTFARHLCARLPWQPSFDEIRASSYGASTRSSGSVEIGDGGAAADVRGQHVIVVEDIVDTGRTVARLREHYLAAGAASVRVATLLSKLARREVDVQLDWIGFEIPDRFVIGFGMDLDGRWRELPHVAVWDPSRLRT